MKQIHVILLLFFLGSLNVYAQRDTLHFNKNWSFRTDEDQKGFTEKWFEKNISGSTVQLPHTWQIENSHTLFYGWAWYQNQYQVPSSWKNKSIWLHFAAVNHTAMVYVNGKKVFEHQGDGFNPFQINMAPYLKFGTQNTITVAVNNAYSNQKVPYGSSFDWPNDGGIIRPVSWVIAHKDAAQNIKLSPVFNPKDSTATLTIQLIGAAKTMNNQWKVNISENNQSTHQSIYAKTIKAEWKNGTWETQIALGKVHPWHFDHPNLYSVNVETVQGNQVLDQISDVIGFRTMTFENGSFYLNGEAIKLMGVEWTAGSNPNYGFAEPDDFIRKMGDRMKEVNCIFTRQHFQQSKTFYDFCDRKGIIVQQEIPLWGGETPSSKLIKGIAMHQITEMIHSNYNHPSIFSWGVGNELSGRDAQMKAMIASMIDSVRKLDPSRYVAYVSNTLTQGFKGKPNFVPDAAALGDYLMMNEYGGSWWELPTGEIGKYLDSVHTSYPEMPFLISEFGLCGPNFRGGDARRIQDMIYHISLYESKPYVIGAIYFDLTDYRTHYPGTTEKNKFRRRVHGVYDMYGNPKASAAVLREQSSPLEVHSIQGSDKDSANVVLYGAMGLPEHEVNGYQLYVTDSAQMKNYQQTKAYPIPRVKPGQRMVIRVKSPVKDGGIVTIVRPTGYITTQKSFYRVLPEEEDKD